MKSSSLLLTLIICAAVAGCGTTMKSDQSGFLSSYSELAFNADEGVATRRAHSGIDPARIQIAKSSSSQVLAAP